MPKTFPILIDVEEIAVGRVMRILNKMPGVARLHLDLEHQTKKPNGQSAPSAPRANLPTTGEQDILAALFKKGPQTADQLRQLFIANGRSPKSINSVLHTVRKNGDIAALPDKKGWALTKKARDRLRHKLG